MEEAGEVETVDLMVTKESDVGTPVRTGGGRRSPGSPTTPTTPTGGESRREREKAEDLLLRMPTIEIGKKRKTSD